jgi:hypothetical protein
VTHQKRIQTHELMRRSHEWGLFDGLAEGGDQSFGLRCVRPPLTKKLSNRCDPLF